MPGSNPQTETAWTPERVRQWFEQRTRSGEDDLRRVTPYHRAAAVLATFDPKVLRVPGLGPPGVAALTQLLSDSVAIAEGETAVRWSLKPEIRRLALGSFLDASKLRSALTWNPRPAGDALQHTLDAYITGKAAPIKSQTETDLGWTALVVTWLSGIPIARELALPDPDDVQRRLNLVHLITPLRAMVGNDFCGRKSEIRRIKQFLFSEGDGDYAPKPLMVTGFGGSGKTTLIAKLLLDYTEGRLDGRAGPFVFIDFDRPSLIPQEPATLLAEAARQLAAQTSEGNEAAESVAVSIEATLKERRGYRSDEALSLGQILVGNFGAVRMNELADAFNVPQWTGRPALVILDTFEEVQYHSQKTVEHIWSWLSALRERIPHVRVIVSGRAPVQIEGQTKPFFDVVEVDELDQDSAVAILKRYGATAATAGFIYDHIGGNPLALRLAGELVRIETGADTFEEFISAEFADRLNHELAQAILFRRILGHVKTKDVRKLAHPGLTLRRISPESIKEVLAGPCGIDVPDIDRARELWKELARETSLVLQESANVLRHRPELRRQMIGLLRAINQKQVDQIHRAAVRYYQRFDDDASRAEELYHRLSLNQSREILDKRWRASAERSLRVAREELPPDALAYLASRSAMPFEAATLNESAIFWQNADLVTWERKTAQWAKELLQQDRYEEVDQALRLRVDRSDDSPLFLLHAKVMRALRDYDSAIRLLEHALTRWPADARQGERIDLLLQLARATLDSGQVSKARNKLKEINIVAARSGSPEQHLEAMLLAVRASAPERGNRILHDIARLVVSWTDSQLRQIPALARDAAAELLEYAVNQSARIIRSVGLGRLDVDRQALLANFLTDWDARYRGAVRNSTLSPAYVAGLRGYGADAWHQWIKTCPPDELGRRMARMLEECQYGGAKPSNARLQRVLRGDRDVRHRRSGEAGSAQRNLLRGEQIDRFSRVITSAFSLDDLEFQIRTNLDLRLDDIVSRHVPKMQMVRQILVWAEQQGATAQLIKALAAERPARPDVQDLLRYFENGAN